MGNNGLRYVSLKNILNSNVSGKLINNEIVVIFDKDICISTEYFLCLRNTSTSIWYAFSDLSAGHIKTLWKTEFYILPSPAAF